MPSGPIFPHRPGAPGYRPTPPKIDRRQPAVVLQPQVSRELQKGINLIANAVRPTLGPRPRLVANEKLLRTEAAEILDDGATIARRITEVKPRGVDIGAMGCMCVCVSIVLISHNMPHVFEVADRIHIHRLGRRACVVDPKSISMSDAVAIMTGAKVVEGQEAAA